MSSPIRRAALVGTALGVVACDVASFAADPKPIFEQTWNVPASSTSISVASLLPTGVTIYSTPASSPPDSSAFLLNFSNVAFGRRLGDDCASCQALNGTTTTKPAFVLAAGNAATLPTNVVSGTLLGASVTYSVTNNLSFDPLRVNTVSANPQGYMLIVVRSGALILGRDSVNGATTPFAAGTGLSRIIALGSGSVTGPIAVDLTLNSPIGDHNELINANGTLNTTAAIVNLRVSSVQINVPNKPITNGASSLDLKGLEPSITDHVTAATLEMDIDNPWSVSGNLNVNFTTQSYTVAKQVSLPATTVPASTQVRTVTLLSSEVQQLFGNQVALDVNGAVNSVSPITVSPKQKVSISNRLILTIRTGS
jgi:hypothetical protein